MDLEQLQGHPGAKLLRVLSFSFCLETEEGCGHVWLSFSAMDAIFERLKGERLLRPLLPPLHVMGPWSCWLPPSCSISLAPSPVLQLAEDQAFFLVR